MEEDLEPGVPAIAEVATGSARPVWSVMIPVHNGACYLCEALASVLEQDPGPEVMQIEVVDNASSDQPEDVVEQLGRGRVGFYRHPENIGAIPNFNACIRRSRGHLLHILHCDDRVAPDFYQEMSRLAELGPDVALLACRCTYLGADGVARGVSPRLLALETPSRDPEPLLYENSIQFSSAVIRRRFYETFGGYNELLVHTTDWEMWIRAVVEGGGLVSPQVLAYFRRSESGLSAQLERTGENLRDHLRMLDVVMPRAPLLDTRMFRQNLARRAAQQAKTFREQGELDSAHASEAILREVSQLLDR